MQKDSFLYKKIYNELKKRINSHIYAPETQLPLESELQAEFEVSAITIKKALSMLTEEELLNRIPGKGTFVCSQDKMDKLTPNKTIGLILEHVSTPFGLDMMYQIDKYSQKHGYRVHFCFSYGDSEKESRDIDYLLQQNVSGLIIMPCHGKHYNAEILKLVLDGFPIVLIDKVFHGIPVSSVQTDNKLATNILVKSHVEKNCNNLALITIDEKGATSLKDRKTGFQQTTQKMGLSPLLIKELSSESNFLDPKPHKKNVDEILRFLQNHCSSVDGIICAEYGIIPDLVAAMKMWNFPNKDNIIISSIDENHLSPDGYTFMHVKQDEKTIAKTAVDVLIKKIHHEDDVKDCYRISPIFYDK